MLVEYKITKKGKQKVVFYATPEYPLIYNPKK